MPIKFFLKHKYSNKIKIPLFLILLSASLILIDARTDGFFGNFVNIFFPCSYSPSPNIVESAPCSLKYDILFACLLAGVIIFSFLYIIVVSILQFKKMRGNDI